MSYTVSWKGKVAHVNYSGSVSNVDIEKAHFELNGDSRFYDCKAIILDISDCDASGIVVDELTIVIATDLGASATLKSLNVAMVSNEEVGQLKVCNYIKRVREVDSPWHFEFFETIEQAEEWLQNL